MINKEPSKSFWSRWYLLVFVLLVAEIILFDWMTRYFD
jgi:hypothetical protein